METLKVDDSYLIEIRGPLLVIFHEENERK